MRKFAKSDKVADLIKHAISNALLTQVEDGRLRWISVVEVRISADFSHAKVFYSVMEPQLTREDAEVCLRENIREIRKYVAGNLRLRQVPELRFQFDDTQDRARRIEDILEEIRKEDHGRDGGA
jgi:ribosome-binding factor A